MKRLFFTVPVAAMALALSQPVLADAGHDHASQEQNAQNHTTEEDSANTEFSAWDVLQNNFKQAQSASDAGKLEEMHVLTDSMAKATATLEAQYPDDVRLATALKQLKQVINDLHIKADGGDTAGTASALKKLEGGLLLVETNLPEDIQNIKEHDGESDTHSEESEHEHGHDGHAH